MKNKLWSLAILSGVHFIAFIILIVGIYKGSTVTRFVYGYFYDVETHSSGWLWVGGSVFSGTALASFVMGIVTLSTRQGDNRGIVTAAGVLGILRGVFFDNAIVAGISAKDTDNEANKPVEHKVKKEV